MCAMGMRRRGAPPSKGKRIRHIPRKLPTHLIAAADGEQYVVTSDSHKARIGSGVLATILTRRKQPIEVSSHALDISISCAVQVSGFFLSTASCTLPLEPFFGLPGSGYEITIHTPDRGVHINTLEADFRTVIRQSSWKDTLSIIKQQILKRYNGTN